MIKQLTIAATINITQYLIGLIFLNKNKNNENLIATNLVGWPIKSGDY